MWLNPSLMSISAITFWSVVFTFKKNGQSEGSKCRTTQNCFQRWSSKNITSAHTNPENWTNDTMNEVFFCKNYTRCSHEWRATQRRSAFHLLTRWDTAEVNGSELRTLALSTDTLSVTGLPLKSFLSLKKLNGSLERAEVRTRATQEFWAKCKSFSHANKWL